MLSMTGFGRASAVAADRRFSIEVRSVNHRGLDIKTRFRDPDGYCDAEIVKAVRSLVERGAVTITLREETPPSGRGLDDTRIRSVFAALQALRRDIGIEAPVDLATVAAFMGEPLGRASEITGEALWEVLRPAVSAALAELCATRAREGEALASDVAARAATLRRLTERITEAAGLLPARFARRLQERLEQLGGKAGVDATRLAQEAAILAEKIDVSEELVRLGAHLARLDQVRETTGAVGRRLEFLVQEIGRELNTIASKAQDADIAGLIIDAKAELEKIREQAQNIE